ncbi:MAG: phage gp6-like head-tail connector protein [Comamonadaceae bacterium]|nr:MAG: phage gp6-like head-tail connector protein [Comamonadaceae bacterium]
MAKAHLRVDGTDEDTLIGAYLGAAYLAVEGAIFRKVHSTSPEVPLLDFTAIVTNDAINSAALLILGHLYANRESVAQGQAVEVPMGAQWLLTPYVDCSAGA